MILLSEMSHYGLADCEFNRQFFTLDELYRSYCYKAAKQGFQALSFNSWRYCHKANITL